jgi:hypothetical protein
MESTKGGGTRLGEERGGNAKALRKADTLARFKNAKKKNLGVARERAQRKEVKAKNKGFDPSQKKRTRERGK